MGVVASNEKAHGNEALTGGKVAKVRKCPPRCIVCCVINDSNKQRLKNHIDNHPLFNLFGKFMHQENW